MELTKSEYELVAIALRMHRARLMEVQKETLRLLGIGSNYKIQDEIALLDTIADKVQGGLILVQG